MRISDWSSDVCSSDLLPEGVVSVLPAGNEAADALVRDSRVDKVTFTGSTAVGRHIAGVCGDRIARVALELGGTSAAIILDDMPIDAVVTTLLPAPTTLSGQAGSAFTPGIGRAPGRE